MCGSVGLIAGPLDEDPQGGHGLFVLLLGLFAPLFGAQPHHQKSSWGWRLWDLPEAGRPLARGIGSKGVKLVLDVIGSCPRYPQ